MTGEPGTGNLEETNAVYRSLLKRARDDLNTCRYALYQAFMFTGYSSGPLSEPIAQHAARASKATCAEIDAALKLEAEA